MCEIRDATDTVAVGSQRELGRSLDNAMARNGRWTLFQYSGSSKRTSSPGGMSTVVDLTGPQRRGLWDVQTNAPAIPTHVVVYEHGVCLHERVTLGTLFHDGGPQHGAKNGRVQHTLVIHEAANALQNRRHGRVGDEDE